ncbi:MAG: DUF4352 domain-containing protein, partial [Flaviflexus sp.]|nr:DUF4352 domain-containing protein [Flaviflexus sp.]
EEPEPTEEPQGDITTEFTSPEFGTAFDFESDLYEGQSGRVTVNSLKPDVEDMIAEYDPSYFKPAEGNIYFLLNVTVENTGGESFSPWLELDPLLIGAEGQEATWAITTIPDDLSDMGELAPGETMTGNMLLEGNKSFLNTKSQLHINLLYGVPVIMLLD